MVNISMTKDESENQEELRELQQINDYNEAQKQAEDSSEDGSDAGGGDETGDLGLSEQEDPDDEQESSESAQNQQALFQQVLENNVQESAPPASEISEDQIRSNTEETLRMQDMSRRAPVTYGDALLGGAGMVLANTIDAIVTPVSNGIKSAVSGLKRGLSGYTDPKGIAPQLIHHHANDTCKKGYETGLQQIQTVKNTLQEIKDLPEVQDIMRLSPEVGKEALAKELSLDDPDPQSPLFQLYSQAQDGIKELSENPLLNPDPNDEASFGEPEKGLFDALVSEVIGIVEDPLTNMLPGENEGDESMRDQILNTVKQLIEALKEFMQNLFNQESEQSASQSF